MRITFPEKFIEDVKIHNDIIQIASEYFEVKKFGDLYRTHCKHRGGDKAPSLTFFPDTQSFYCFGCHAGKRGEKTNGSDVISFIQWVEDIPWQEAIMFLAKKAGLAIPQAELSKEEMDKLEAYDNLLEQNRQYWANLTSSEEVLQWFYSKGMTDTEIIRWRLGASKNLPVYSIADEYGRTVGFSTRVNKDSKYINSSNSLIFKKGNILYGLNNIKKEIRKHKFVVIVEGFNDTILLQKYGVPAVGLMGTAITEGHISLLHKYTDKVLLFLDGDIPGLESTIDNIKILRKERFEVEALNVVGFDPDEVATKYEQNTLQFIIDHSRLAFQFLINNVLDKYFNAALKLKTETIKKLEEILDYIEDPQEKEIYRTQLVKVISMEDKDWRM